jgi:hypothetical protein
LWHYNINPPIFTLQHQYQMLSRLEYGKRFVRQASPLKPEGTSLGNKITVIARLPSIALQRCVARSSHTMRVQGGVWEWKMKTTIALQVAGTYRYRPSPAANQGGGHHNG